MTGFVMPSVNSRSTRSNTALFCCLAHFPGCPMFPCFLGSADSSRRPVHYRPVDCRRADRVWSRGRADWSADGVRARCRSRCAHRRARGSIRSVARMERGFEAVDHIFGNILNRVVAMCGLKINTFSDVKRVIIFHVLQHHGLILRADLFAYHLPLLAMKHTRIHHHQRRQRVRVCQSALERDATSRPTQRCHDASEKTREHRQRLGLLFENKRSLAISVGSALKGKSNRKERHYQEHGTK